MLVEVQAAVRPARTTGFADHQAQHAVAPAACPVLIRLGEQIIHRVDPLGVQLAQRLTAEVAAGIQIRVVRGAFIPCCGCPAKALFVIRIQCRATTGVGRVEEEILHVHGHEFQRAGGFVDIRAAGDLAVMFLAFTAASDVLLPARQVQQARVVTHGKATLGLAAAVVRQTYLAQ